MMHMRERRAAMLNPSSSDPPYAPKIKTPSPRKKPPPPMFDCWDFNDLQI